MAWAIETYALTKRFPVEQGWRSLLRRSNAPQSAVDGVTLHVRQGELFGLLGPNGAGKTTLIKLLSTLVVPTSGAARVNGYDLRDETAIKASIGLVTSDERSFYWRLTGRQNLEFFASLHNLAPGRIPEGVEEALQQVGLQEMANRRFQTYSSGMRQRLSIARALLNRPSLLFLDEPTKGLDPTATRRLHDLIRDLSGQSGRRDGITVFLTTHYLEEARQLCDRIAIMHRGRIQACGSLPELRQALHLHDRYRILVRGFSPEARPELESRLPGLRISTPPEDVTLPGSASQEGLTSLEFEDRPEKCFEDASENRLENESEDSQRDGILNGAIDLIRRSQAHILSISQQPASLELIFSRLVDGNEPAPAPPVEPPTPLAGEGPVKPNAVARPPLRATLHVLWSFLARDWETETSYRFSFLFQFLGVFFSVAVFYFIAQLLGPAAAPYLAPYGGDYFSFVLIGIAFAGYFGVGLSSFSDSLRQAQTTGTLEAMLTTPTRLSVIILASSFWQYLMTTFRVLVYLAVGAFFLHVNLGKGNYPAALLVLLLTVTSFSSFGILAASFIMVVKRGNPITWLFSSISTLLGGVYYPITILPGWLQWLSNLLPITYALHAMRLTLLQGASLAQVGIDVLALALFSLFLIPISLYSFRYAVQRARIDGSLTHY